MSRGGRGGGRGGWRGRGGFGGVNLPMGMTHADVTSLSREPSALYPPMEVPTMQNLTDSEKSAVKHQLQVVARLKRSAYWIAEETKTDADIERYSDRYRATAVSRPPLKAEDLCQEFFPASLWDGYFNPAKKPKVEPKKQKRREKVNLDLLEAAAEKGDDGEGGENASEAGSEQPDYDEEDGEGDDYEDNYFDNGEGDDDDMLGNDENVGGGDYD